MLQTSTQYYAALALCVAMGWLRHALVRVRQDLAAGNAGPGAGIGALAASEHLPLQLQQPADPLLPRGGAGGLGGKMSDADDEDARPAFRRALPLRPLLPSCARLLACGPLQRAPWLLRVLDVALFGLCSLLGWLNMILVMSMNAGFLGSIVAGEMLGVLMFDAPGGASGFDAVVSAGACH